MTPVPTHTTLKGALIERGYKCREIALGAACYREYRARNGWLWLTRKSYYDYPFVSLAVARIAKDKVLSCHFAESLGVSVPKSVLATHIDIANRFLEEHKRVIVKPVNLSGGKGLTLNITSREQLKKALAAAMFDGRYPLIQKQFEGEEVRFTVIDGVVYSAILRETPRVVGDGVRTVAALVAAENESRNKLSFPLLTYPQLTTELVGDSLIYSERVPKKSEIIELSKATMIKHGASFYGVTHRVHSSYIALAESFANALGASMLVVDIMVTDYSQAASSDNYIFLELNTSPALEIYSSLRGGDQPDVIAALADLVDVCAHRRDARHPEVDKT